MEKFVNEVVYRLSTKIPKENVEIVKNVMYMVLQNYDMTEKCTEVANPQDMIPPIVDIYCRCREVDGLSPKSIEQYRRTLNIFFTYTNKNITEITTEDLRVFFYLLKDKSNMEFRALDNQRSYLKAFFSWLNDNQYISNNPMTPIKPFKYDKKVKQALSSMELEMLRRACKNVYETAVLETLYSTACRVSELVNIKLEDINFDTGDVLITKAKGKKERITWLDDRAILAIKEYIKDRDYDTVYLFENFRKPHNQLTIGGIRAVTYRLQNRTGIALYPHKMRRTSATHLYRKGMRIEEIKEFLGHKSIDTTMEYTKIDRSAIKANHVKYMS